MTIDIHCRSFLKFKMLRSKKSSAFWKNDFDWVSLEALTIFESGTLVIVLELVLVVESVMPFDGVIEVWCGFRVVALSDNVDSVVKDLGGVTRAGTLVTFTSLSKGAEDLAKGARSIVGNKSDASVSSSTSTMGAFAILVVSLVMAALGVGVVLRPIGLVVCFVTFVLVVSTLLP